MTLSSKAFKQTLATDSDIPTLDTPLEVSATEQQVDKQVNQLIDELQAVVHQHLYQAMVKSLHQIMAQEGPKLTQKMLDKLTQQLPLIIATATQGKEDKTSSSQHHVA